MGADQSSLGLNSLPMTNCRIVVVAPRNGDECLVELAKLPKEARILATGRNVEELREDGDLFTEGNVILNVSGNSEVLAEIINEMPFLTWIHSITAGIDHILCPEIINNSEITLTNAKGVFSHSLAEYVIQSCMHFAKDIPRLMNQKKEKKWEKFFVSEIRGKTMGIVGYGSIGRACAKLAKAFDMNVIGLRRNPDHGLNEKYLDEVVGTDKLNYIFESCDFVVVCLALTPQTRHFIKASNLSRAKKGLVLINIGRGPLIDEEALVKALSDGTIAAAALDVFTIEPLPESSPFWGLPNVLISPHNADYLVDSRQKSVRFFVENCERFLKEEELECIVDKESGY